MRTTSPDPRPSFETREQLWELLNEALEDTQEGMDMSSDEWKRFREDLLAPRHPAKRAS